MIRAGVVGHPVAHSLSPKMHGYWLTLHGIDGEYKPYDVAPEALERFIKTLPERRFAGCNITIPHKGMALKLVDRVDDLAVAVGAVNTVIVEGGQTVGTNTDVAGFYENVKPHLGATRRAVVLGAGGAARAVVVALRQLGFSNIVITNRSRDKAEAIAGEQGLEVAAWEDRSGVLEGADLLVNTTSLGLAGKPPLEISLEALPVSALVTDIIYAPLDTPLLLAARTRGNPVVDGLGMLLHQAAPGFAAWFGVMPEVTNDLRQHILAP